MNEIYASLPNDMRGELKREEIDGFKHLPDLFVKLGLSKSKNEARKDIEGEGAYLNNSKLDKNSAGVPLGDILEKSTLPGNFILLRKGKKKYFFLRMQP